MPGPLMGEGLARQPGWLHHNPGAEPHLGSVLPASGVTWAGEPGAVQRVDLPE